VILDRNAPDSDNGLPQTLAQGLVLAWADRAGAMLCLKAADSGALLACSPAWLAFTGQPEQALVGNTDAAWAPPALAAALRASERAAVAEGAPVWTDHSFEKQGERQHYQVLRLIGPGAGPTRTSVMACLWLNLAEATANAARQTQAMAQIEALQAANAQLRRDLAEQSPSEPREVSSGLHQRAHFEEQLRRELDLSHREQREFSLVYIDIDLRADGGHSEPGRALALVEALGRAVRNGTRAMDASCRLEGHRFAVLLSGVGLATAHSRMESLRRQCATQIVMHQGQALRLTVSMGVASFPHTAADGEQLLRAATVAVEQARQRGGNQVALASIRLGEA
jgi:diguanylate cyclase (GGDEF)-like protein